MMKGRVTHIDLNGNSLNGNIPPEIENLANLQSLYLNNNYLSGSIPPEIGNLANLVFLNLSSNYLSGNIPAEIGNLANLSSLSLRGNVLSGNIPPEIWNLTNLQGLDLRSNQISGQLPSEIGNLSQLTSLFLSYNLLEGDIPQTLLNLSNLTYLRIRSNRFTSLPDISSLINLQQIYIDYNAFTFDDILPLTDFTGTFRYSDQQKTDEEQYHTLTEGDPLLLSTTIKNSGNTYEWYKSGSYSSIGYDTTYKINSFSAQDAGIYYCIIENPAVDPGFGGIFITNQKHIRFIATLLSSKIHGFRRTRPTKVCCN